jgi:hypothetical protein
MRHGEGVPSGRRLPRLAGAPATAGRGAASTGPPGSLRGRSRVTLPRGGDLCPAGRPNRLSRPFDARLAEACGTVAAPGPPRLLPPPRSDRGHPPARYRARGQRTSTSYWRQAAIRRPVSRSRQRAPGAVAPRVPPACPRVEGLRRVVEAVALAGRGAGSLSTPCLGGFSPVTTDEGSPGFGPDVGHACAPAEAQRGSCASEATQWIFVLCGGLCPLSLVATFQR